MSSAPAAAEADSGLVRALGAWYDRAARALPWRASRDPYAIWVSEVMLQQTRVETVLRYYPRFMARFPSVRALAAAPVDDVLGLWAGLGYYRRARTLHLAARELCQRYGGELPRGAAELRTLGGIGRYTAGAIASIAYDERAALCDGNVARVLARVYALEQDMTTARGMAAAWRHAEALVPAKRPGRFNQALMELGATVCLPRNPDCARCPLASRCAARAAGRQEELPLRSRKAALRAVALLAAVVREPSGKILLGQRAPEGLFGGLWEPPTVARAGGRDELARCGIAPELPLASLGRLTHVLTHRRLEVDVLGAETPRAFRLPRAPAPYQKLAWRSVSARAVPALSTLARKLIARLGTALVLLAMLFASASARAEDALSPEDRELVARLSEERGFYARALVQNAFGVGLRFNNPYRLKRPLGETAESVSLTAPYYDGGLAITFGEPDGLQHGMAARLSISLDGVPQQALGGSYLVAYRGPRPVMLYARLGGSLLLAPDANFGLESGAGCAWFFTGAIGVGVELVGNLFYGAGTPESEITTYPVLSAQGGLLVDWELLP